MSIRRNDNLAMLVRLDQSLDCLNHENLPKVRLHNTRLQENYSF